MAVWQVDIAACFQKPLHRFHLAAGGSQMEWSCPCRIQSVDRSAMGQEQIYQLQIAAEDSFVEGSIPANQGRSHLPLAADSPVVVENRRQQGRGAGLHSYRRVLAESCSNRKAKPNRLGADNPGKV